MQLLGGGGILYDASRILHILCWHCNLYDVCIFCVSGCGIFTFDVYSLCSGLQSIAQPTLPVLETHQRSQQTMTGQPCLLITVTTRD